MSFLVSNQRDLSKQLQYVFENSRTTPSNWGNLGGSNPNFIQAGYNPRFVYRDQPTGIEVRKLGSEDKDSTVLVGAQGLLELRTNIVDVNLVKWIFNSAGGGASTIDDSATFLFSHKILGTENYKTLAGCLPLSGTLTIPPKGLLELSAQILVTQPNKQATASGLSGTPVFASALTGPVWTHLSGGSIPFLHNSKAYRTRGMTISVTRELSMIDSDGDSEIQFLRAAKRVVNGTVNVFEVNKLLEDAAVDQDENTMSRVIKTSTSTASFTGVTFDDHAIEYDQDSSDSRLEILPFKAKTIAFS